MKQENTLPSQRTANSPLHEGTRRHRVEDREGRTSFLCISSFFPTGNGVENYVQHQYQETQSLSNHSIDNYAAGNRSVYFQAPVHVCPAP